MTNEQGPTPPPPARAAPAQEGGGAVGAGEVGRTYILVCRDTKFWFMGPFDSEFDAAQWGGKAYPASGDPRWQTISLTKEQLAHRPPVITPPPIGDATQNRMNRGAEAMLASSDVQARFRKDCAVNSHDELLAALKAMEAFVTDGYETRAKRMAGRKALIAARLAIARAEGERGE